MIRERFDLSGKSALVVGGRGYLGQRFCAALTEFGATVSSADLQQASLAASKAGPCEAVEGVQQYVVDVAQPESVSRLVDQVVASAGRIDVLIYSVTAKPKGFYLPFAECSLESWQTILRAELDGLYLVAQKVGSAMEKSRAGSIILLSSIYGVVGNDQRIYEGANLAELYGGEQSSAKQIYAHIAYAASKGAVISMTRFLAAYWEGRNIRVNSLSPGGVAHPGENEEFLKRYSYRVPLGRKAEGDEIASAAVFLASDASSYVNGQNLIVDGGWTAW